MPDELEERVQTWFRHLPADHPLVRVLFKAAVARRIAATPTTSTPRQRR